MLSFKRKPFWTGKTRCYELLRCKAEKSCPAVAANDKPCWEIPDTFCNQEFRHCEKCQVFIRYGKSRVQASGNLKRVVLTSKPFWMSLVLLALILLFTFVTFAKLSAYGGKLTGDFRHRQLISVQTAAEALADFYDRIAIGGTFFSRNPDRADAMEYLRSQLLKSDSQAVLAVIKVSPKQGRVEPWYGNASYPLSLLQDIIARPGAAESSYTVSGTADSLDRLVTVSRLSMGDDVLLLLTDANQVLKHHFSHAGYTEPLLYWVLDGSGRIIRLPPQMSEPLISSITKRNFSRCSGCHVSDYDEKLAAQTGTHVIPYPLGKKSLIAWSEATVLGQKWTIVLTMPASDINGLLNDQLISTRLYLFFAIIMVALFLVFNFVNLHRQVLLEAEKKVLQNNLAAAEKVRAMENTLEKVQRMEGLSVLAGGLAHEINNPITNIVLYTRLVRQRVDDPDLITDLEIIERESKKVKFIVFDMLSFIRRTNPSDKQTMINLNALMDELLEINTAMLRKNGITIRYEMQHELPAIMADGNKIMQVMINIFSNAMDALNAGGCITLATGSEGSAPDKTFVFFSIADNGSGIPPDQLEKVFEPFYTTKPAGVGTGLGLPVSKAIVEKMGGRIHIHSASGQGTTVKVILPLA